MAHKTMINGTAYKISGGKTLVNGTAYKIKGGKTLVNGTAYNISLVNETRNLTITGNGFDIFQLAYYKIGNTAYYPNGEITTYMLPKGTVITLVIVANNEYGSISIDTGAGIAFGVPLPGLTSEFKEVEWDYTLNRNATIDFSATQIWEDLGATFVANYGTIRVTESDGISIGGGGNFGDSDFSI